MNNYLKNTQLQKSYQDYEKDLKTKGFKLGCILAIILHPLCIIVDYFYYFPHFFELVFIRLFCSLVIFILLITTPLETLRKRVNFYILIWFLLIQSAICFEIYITDKVNCPYYAGLNLIILLISITLPLKAREMIILCLLTLFMYLFAILDSNLQLTGTLVSNLYFLILTCIIAITSSYFNSRLRFKEFCLSYELGNKNDELKRLNNLRTEFFANMSHEFRTPLTLILSPMQDIKDKINSNKITNAIKNSILENVNITRENAHRLLKMVNDLLDVIGLDKSSVKLNLQTIEINEFIKSRIDSMKHMANLKNIDLIKEINNEQIFIKADKDMLDKIILNLINNAIKFSKNDSNIIIKTEIIAQKATIKVIDHGIGIKKENLKIIFERFKQADGSHTRKFQGTGLGLALVKEFCELQNAKVNVESELGKGTIFSIEFPIDQSNKTNNSCAIQKEDDPISKIYRDSYSSIGFWSKDTNSQTNSTAKSPTNKPKILIVDDEPDMLNFVARIVKEHNYEVITEDKGDKVMQKIKDTQPNLILLDIMLPEIDGLTLCKQIRQHQEFDLIKIILLSAKADHKSKIEGYQNGADEYITKPFDNLELISRIKNLLQKQNFQKNIFNNNLNLKDNLLKLKDTQNQLKNKLSDAENKLINSEKINTIGHLSTGLIHEVNNPLTYILSATNFLKNDNLIQNNLELKEIVTDIDDGLKTIKNLIGDLKTFAHINKDTDFTKFNIQKSIDNALKFSKPICKNLKITNNSTNLEVIGSKNHITQILMNLISNAAKAIKKQNPKNPEIIICTTTTKNKAKISITDNGCGIKAENLKEIFNPFYTTNNAEEGLGLGLNICKTIIENHNQKITAISELGKGSTFEFELELATKKLKYD